MAITSKTEICNMALGHLGNYGTIEDIDTPTSDQEKAFALWYDTTREYALKLLLPNFALSRRITAKKSTTPIFGYALSYEYPSDAIRVLGFGDIDEKEFSYNIEADDTTGDLELQIDEDFTGGMKLRFVKNITDVTKFGPDFAFGFALILASKVALQITQDAQKVELLEGMLPGKLSEISGMNAQENPPVRKSESKFLEARRGFATRNNEKK